MTTPNNNFPDFSIPQRTKKVADLILILAKSMRDYMDARSNDAGERNVILAMCEVCVSIPPAWFATPERLLIVGTIQNLYGNPHQFIKEIDEGTISFYNKFAEESNLPGAHKTLDELVLALHNLHDKEFGTVI
jgi:hypothetical protein